MTKRTLDLSVEFLDEHAAGFAFRVVSAFRAALDILLTERIDVVATRRLRDIARLQGRDKDDISRIRVTRLAWTEGKPPLYAFKEGDLLHSHDGVYSVSIRSAIPDAKLGKDKRDGVVNFQLFHGRTKIDDYSCSQGQFVDLLHTGICEQQDIHLEIERPLHWRIKDWSASLQVLREGFSEILSLDYIDHTGSPSRREATIRKVTYSPDKHIHYLHGVCHEKHAPRQFRADRIESATVARTGEIMTGQQLIQRLLTD